MTRDLRQPPRPRAREGDDDGYIFLVAASAVVASRDEAVVDDPLGFGDDSQVELTQRLEYGPQGTVRHAAAAPVANELSQQEAAARDDRLAAARSSRARRVR